MRPQADRGRGRAAAQRIVEIARCQHGVISVSQVPDVSRSAIRTCIDAGWLRRVHRGVYALSGSRTRRGIWMAAVLACDGSVLSHVSAAELWRLLKFESGPVHVISPDPRGPRVSEWHPGTSAESTPSIRAL